MSKGNHKYNVCHLIGKTPTRLADFIQPQNCEISNSGGNIFCKTLLTWTVDAVVLKKYWIYKKHFSGWREHPCLVGYLKLERTHTSLIYSKALWNKLQLTCTIDQYQLHTFFSDGVKISKRAAGLNKITSRDVHFEALDIKLVPACRVLFEINM